MSNVMDFQERAVTACDLRVLVRYDDGTIGSYAVDGIPSAARLRDELGVVGDIFTDPECVEDMREAFEASALTQSVFESVQSALTRGATNPAPGAREGG